MPVVYKIVDVHLPQGLRRDAIETSNSIINSKFRDIMTGMIKADYAVYVDAVTAGKPQEAMNLLWQLGLDLKQLPVQAKWNPLIYNLWGKRQTILKGEWEYLIKQFPDAAPVCYNAGLWLLKVHRYKEAIVHLRAATESQRLPESARGTAL